MAHGVFQTLAEGPEEKHIADDMAPASVEKHGSNKAKRVKVRGDGSVAGDEVIAGVVVKS